MGPQVKAKEPDEELKSLRQELDQVMMIITKTKTDVKSQICEGADSTKASVRLRQLVQALQIQIATQKAQFVAKDCEIQDLSAHKNSHISLSKKLT